MMLSGPSFDHGVISRTCLILLGRDKKEKVGRREMEKEDRTEKEVICCVVNYCHYIL